MQISLSGPSTPQTAKTGAGYDALFEEVSQAAGDEKDGDSVVSFDALIQAALAAASGAPLPADPLVSVVDTGTSEAKAADALGSAQTPGEFAARDAGTAAAAESLSPAVGSETAVDTDAGRFPVETSQATASSADPADTIAAIQARIRLTTAQQGLPAGEPSDSSIGDAAAAQPSDSVAEEGEPTDDVMLSLEEAMESFTPIPASVLALMRAESVSGPSTGAIVSSGPVQKQPLVATESEPDGLETIADEATQEDFLSLFPTGEFPAVREVATDHFASTSGAFTEDQQDSSPETLTATLEPGIQTPHVQISDRATSASPAGRENLPIVPATREAIGAFAIDQIIARTDSRDGEPVSRIEARIDPPELGRMSIEISRTAEGLSAHLTVEDPSVLALLDQQMRDVQQTLEAAGVPMTSFTMSAGSERDAPQQQSHGDDEELASLASTVRSNRSGGSRPTTTSRREIDTTA